MIFCRGIFLFSLIMWIDLFTRVHSQFLPYMGMYPYCLSLGILLFSLRCGYISIQGCSSFSSLYRNVSTFFEPEHFIAFLQNMDSSV